ncbi:double-strand break repair protein AddB [Jannaschia pohangensis]|uniref:Double-strand break repair protein AddB n=1 Tax=Jannaschia pohangensis TaxID=390807 RepID=A0A1I3TYI1_9RHOB|nr:double-strand break repair protein AddB [Jannaschia pohangensis]SFJ75543.1 double-strand break repair protein AddB [Jannaschia pohangensis]
MKGLFAEPMGVDFSAALADGLHARLTGSTPQAMARVTLLTNTSRMARRTEAALASRGATLLPRIGLVSQLAPLLAPGEAPVADISSLATRLRLTQLVDLLLAKEPGLSPRAAAFDLAGSLANLLDELQEEEMDPSAFDALDVSDMSTHWERSLRFLRIVTGWSARDGNLTEAAAQGLALDRLVAGWERNPPQDPVIIAGSTASRTPTRALIRHVLDLPSGVVILPGLDTDMPEEAWQALTEEAGHQDHPQYRHAALLAALGRTRSEVPRWSERAPAVPARNALISLALRPAPATDAWRAEGPELPGVAEACAGITLLRAPSPGAEAATIAAGLRAALAQGKRAALITPDRALSRQVAAQLDRWRIIPDDSAGIPLGQTSPGRFLLQLAEMRGQPVEAEPLVILMSHPLTHSGRGRADHLTRLREVEIELIRAKPLAFPDRAALTAWLNDPEKPRLNDAWTEWLADMLDAVAAQPDSAPLIDHVTSHLELAEALTRGSADEAGALWSDAAGRAARQMLDRMIDAAPHRGETAITARDYARILHALLSGEEVRETFSPHPEVMIWGALEARVRSADLVILGGLNDDVWPGQPAPDPWLNRAMRRACGLRLPDRSTGLSAHDFQQAASGAEVWLSRAVRSAEADTVPSRWLNRIEGLLGGIGPHGEAALAGMVARGDRWLATAALLDRPDARHPTARAPRPAPRLPRGIKLERISVTGVERLIRDPYAIYAENFLRLRALPALRQGPDARLRGEIVHEAMERFARAVPDTLPENADAILRATLEQALADIAPWPGPRRLWLGKFDRAAADFLAAEAERRAKGRPLHLEDTGKLTINSLGLVLTARADRIDDLGDAVAIYDYKTGTAPAGRQQRQFAKQLLLEAMMVEDGGFAGIAQRRVDEVAYLTVGTRYAETSPEDFGPEAIARTRADFLKLIGRYAEGQPFIARLAPDLLTYVGDYDQLSRFGEWDDTQSARVIPVGQ